MVRSMTYGQRGFTLIELIVVMAIVALLLTIAVPRYFVSIDRSKETVLKQSLAVMRDALDKFYGDVGRYPNDLDELVARRYLRSLPVDPLTERADTWQIVAPPSEALKGSVYDVRSGAPGAAAGGTPYGEL